MIFDYTFGQYQGKNTKEKIINYIKANYKGVLGNDVSLLDEEGGLDKIRNKYFKK